VPYCLHYLRALRYSNVRYATSTIHMDVRCARAPTLATASTTARYHVAISACGGHGFAIGAMDFATTRERRGAVEATQPPRLPSTPC
jgi:hypothetical protein